MKNVAKGIIFYAALTVIILFACGGYAAFSFYLPTIIAFAVIAVLCRTNTEKEFFKFTGISWLENLNIVKKTFGNNSFTEE